MAAFNVPHLKFHSFKLQNKAISGLQIWLQYKVKLSRYGGAINLSNKELDKLENT